jgi:hypothetical protein
MLEKNIILLVLILYAIRLYDHEVLCVMSSLIPHLILVKLTLCMYHTFTKTLHFWKKNKASKQA